MGRRRLPDGHGKRYTYQRGSRCNECQQANRDYDVEYRKMRRRLGNPIVKRSRGQGTAA